MKKLSEVTKELLAIHNRRPRKHLGQNFLINQEILDRIIKAANIGPSDIIIEIGTGLGVLTDALARKCKKVITIECDKELLKISQDILNKYNNIEYLAEDVLDLDLNQITKGFGSYKIVANLPYYITSPILDKIFNLQNMPELIIIMVQREIAERLSAKPGSKIYGSLSVFAQFYAQISINSFVPKFAFYPQPKVSSSIVVLKPYQTSPWKTDKKLFFEVVHAAFQQRRKKIRNSLSDFGEAINQSGIDISKRPETLSIEEFIKLTNTLC